MQDPWAFQRWAFDARVGSPTRKLLLMALATMADSSTGRCQAKQTTLAHWCEVSDRSLRPHLKGLEEQGLIARRAQHRDDGSRRSDEYLLLAPWVSSWPDGQIVRMSHPEESSGREPTGSFASEPTGSLASNQPEAGFRARTTTNGTATTRDSVPSSSPQSAGAPKVTLPDGFPEELRGHLKVVWIVLRGLAAKTRHAKEVKAEALVNVVMPRQYKPLVRAVYDYAAWSEANPHRRHKDVVGAYRNWLDRCEDLASFEPLKDGRPVPGASSTAPHPTSARERRLQADEEQNARLRETIMRRRGIGQ